MLKRRSGLIISPEEKVMIMANTFSRRFKYAKLVSKASGKSIFTAAREMNRSCRMFGMTAEEYYIHEFYKLSFTQQARESKKTVGNHNRKKQAILNIMEKTGLSREDLRQIRKEINAKKIVKVSYFLYNRLEMYKLNEEELDEFLHFLADRNALAQELRKDFRRIDKGELTYADTADRVARYYEMTEEIMTKTIEDALREVLEPGRPDITGDSKRFFETCVDMEATRNLLGFNLTEYIMFGFADKTLEEKRTFINENERAVVLDSINDMTVADNLDNKYKTYQYLAPYYGRDMVLIESKRDFSKFKEFCADNPKFVRKLAYDSMGRGVQPMTVPGYEEWLKNEIADSAAAQGPAADAAAQGPAANAAAQEPAANAAAQGPAANAAAQGSAANAQKSVAASSGSASASSGSVFSPEESELRSMFDQMLIDEPDGFILEGLIEPHEDIIKLNPDSVNTIRLITYYDRESGKTVTANNSFMKVGRKGSFVDNGGAGGIFVAINDEKGFFESNGIDEKGRRYDLHPEHGYQFEGYQLPAWEDALELGLKIADKIPGFSYIGWDMTYTKDNEWVIVEGNSITQFLGQQSTRIRGAKKQLLETVGYTEEL